MRTGWTFLPVALAGLVACGGEPVIEQQAASRAVHAGARTIAALDEDSKAALVSRRIFFGHQSVGSNIMDGVASLVREDPSLGLRVVEADSIPSLQGGYFAHGAIGQNGQPVGKTDDFARRVENGLHERVDVAFHKYCYVDIDTRSDWEQVFAHYRDSMARLAAAYPEVTFVHVTVPVTHVQTGPKALVKKLIGRAPGGYLDNLRREQFNERMRREYSGREPLFDLAAIEATSPDGRQEVFSFDGMTGRALHVPYGSDGRHLNEHGRRRVAEELLVMLASLPRPHVRSGGEQQ